MTSNSSIESTESCLQAKEIEMALRSGLNSSLAWSLNALTVLSFNSQQPLLIAKHPGILQALLEVGHKQDVQYLHWETNVALATDAAKLYQNRPVLLCSYLKGLT